MSFPLIPQSDNPPDRNRTVIRLITTAYPTKNGFALTKKATYLKRKCINFNWIEEEIQNVDAHNVICRIINWDECEDGIYEVIGCNFKKDWETGWVEDYDFQLVPFTE